MVATYTLVGITYELQTSSYKFDLVANIGFVYIFYEIINEFLA